MENRPVPTVLCGSFRRAPELLREDYAKLLLVGCKVLSPRSVRHDVEKTGFVFMAGERGLPPEHLERAHLRAIRCSRFVWLFAPGGYVGVAGAMEIGFAVGVGVPVYSAEPPVDVALVGLVRVVAGPEIAVKETAAMNRPRDDDECCEHGATGYCGLCVAVGENKLSAEDAMRIAREKDRNKSTFPGECPEDDHRC